jgi:hypothetical protein
MKPDAAACAGLAAVIRHDRGAVGGLSRDLALALETLRSDPAEFRNRAAVAYLLHNIYNALENLFEQVSRTFENHVVDTARWHRELLDKMFLDIPGWRPALLTGDLRPMAHELRGFRHIFRHSYDLELDPARLSRLAERWLACAGAFSECLERFCVFLEQPESRA